MANQLPPEVSIYLLKHPPSLPRIPILQPHYYIDVEVCNYPIEVVTSITRTYPVVASTIVFYIRGEECEG